MRPTYESPCELSELWSWLGPLAFENLIPMQHSFWELWSAHSYRCLPCPIYWSYIRGAPVPDQCAEVRGIWGRYVYEGRVKWLGIRIDNNKVFEVDMYMKAGSTRSSTAPLMWCSPSFFCRPRSAPWSYWRWGRGCCPGTTLPGHWLPSCRLTHRHRWSVGRITNVYVSLKSCEMYTATWPQRNTQGTYYLHSVSE